MELGPMAAHANNPDQERRIHKKEWEKLFIAASTIRSPLKNCDKRNSSEPEIKGNSRTYCSVEDKFFWKKPNSIKGAKIC